MLLVEWANDNPFRNGETTFVWLAAVSLRAQSDTHRVSRCLWLARTSRNLPNAVVLRLE
jgi:hypothetical protein